LPHDRDVRDARNAVQRNGRFREQRRSHDRQRGVLGPVRFDRTGKLMAAANAQRGFETVEHVHRPGKRSQSTRAGPAKRASPRRVAKMT
jgi:hypothetical protein